MNFPQRVKMVGRKRLHGQSYDFRALPPPTMALLRRAKKPGFAGGVSGTGAGGDEAASQTAVDGANPSSGAFAGPEVIDEGIPRRSPRQS